MIFLDCQKKLEYFEKILEETFKHHDNKKGQYNSGATHSLWTIIEN